MKKKILIPLIIKCFFLSFQEVPSSVAMVKEAFTRCMLDILNVMDFSHTRRINRQACFGMFTCTCQEKCKHIFLKRQVKFAYKNIYTSPTQEK